MKDTRTETVDTVPDASTELPSPHFDEFAVAVAQPVEPLTPRKRPIASRVLRLSLYLLAYLAFVLAGAGVAYFAPPSSGEDKLSAATTGETQSDALPAGAVTDGSAVMPATEESITTPRIRHGHSRRLSRVPLHNLNIQIVGEGEGKQAPRKVGEIRYGRPSNQP